MPRLRHELYDLFVKRVQVTDDCWIWTGAVDSYGYGLFVYRERPSMKHRSKGAHRWYWEYAEGEVPEGFTLDHLCENKVCIKLEHIRAVPHRDNVLRSKTTHAAVNARKTHCIRGHEFTKENTYTTPDQRRQCRTCIKLRSSQRK